MDRDRPPGAGYGSASATWDLSGRLVEIALGGVTRRFDLFGGRIESDASSGAIGALDLGEVSLAPLSGERTYRHFDFRGNVSFVSNDAPAPPATCSPTTISRFGARANVFPYLFVINLLTGLAFIAARSRFGRR